MRVSESRGGDPTGSARGAGRSPVGSTRSRIAAAAALAAVARAAVATARWWWQRARPPRSTTTLVLRVTDRGAPVAARVLLFSAAGAPLHMGALDLYGARQGGAACAIAPDIINS